MRCVTTSCNYALMQVVFGCNLKELLMPVALTCRISIVSGAHAHPQAFGFIVSQISVLLLFGSRICGS